MEGKKLNSNCPQERKKAYETAQFKLFLEHMKHSGVQIYMDGQQVKNQDIAAQAVCEDNSCYMGDYVLGEKGNLEQIRFDKINIC